MCAAYFVDDIDIGKFTMKVIDDVRTVNKNVHFRPSNNCYSVNELASLWEKKIGRTIPRVTISEDDLLAVAAGSIIHQFLLFCVSKLCPYLMIYVYKEGTYPYFSPY